jgi:hypothetical protein
VASNLFLRWLSSGFYRRVDWCKFSNISEVCTASTIALMMEAAGTSEMLVNFHQIIRRNNPEDSGIQTALQVHLF